MASSWRGRRIVELITKHDASQRKESNDAPSILKCIEQDTNNAVEQNTVIETKISLVPNCNNETSSDADEGDTNAPVTQKYSSSSNSSSSSSDSSISSSESSSSSSSETEPEPIEQLQANGGQQTNEVDVISRTPESYVNKITTTQEDSQVDTQYESSRRPVRICAKHKPIVLAPQYTDESDFDDDVTDPTFNFEDKFANASRHARNYLFPLNLNHSSSDTDSSDQNTKKGRKRQKNLNKWKQNRAKKLRNEGASYRSLAKSNKIISARHLKLPCTNCKLNCSQKIDDTERYDIFNNFWKLGDLSKQRLFINSCMIDIQPKYKYTNAENPRRPNKAFFFTVKGQKIRVCKTFYNNTLDITDRMIHTIRINTNENGFVMEERRGKHGNNKTLSPELVTDIKRHIESIPRMESHYLSAQTIKEYIPGGKTIKDLYRDFSKSQAENGKDIGNYLAYYKIFTTEYNLSFYCPKKDQCDLCTSFENSDHNQKLVIEVKYRAHLKEKKLSRKEKLNDRMKADNDNKVVVYDLEAVLQCSRGETSAFYYKSKINSYNLTMTELNNKDTKNAYDNVHCYFWTEIEAKRGAIEIGSCVWEFLKKICCEGENSGKNIIFYSDNCCGPNKNKYIATLYLYAVQTLNINSITHKFLIRGHTQNEADSVHSLIEKEVKKNLKSGPIYTPDQYVTLIKSAKKSNPPINVYAMTCNMFMDIKDLQEEWGYNFNVNTDGQTVNWNDIKQLKMCKGNPFTLYYKNSYEDATFKEVDGRNKRKKMKNESDIVIKQAYTERQLLSTNKKKDLKELLTKGLIPSYYDFYYSSIL